MKIYPRRNTYTQFQKRSLPVSVHLNESDLLFQCIPLLKYIKVLSNHILTTVLLFQCRSKGNISGGARERRRREALGGCGGMLPQKILKSIGLEMLFPAFSKSYL